LELNNDKEEIVVGEGKNIKKHETELTPHTNAQGPHYIKHALVA
jgi:hypothetical protein